MSGTRIQRRTTTPLVLLALVLGATASAGVGAESRVETRLGSLRLPADIGRLEYLGERTPPRADVPAATYSYRAVGLSLDIHVYDHGPSLADGIDSPAVIQAFERIRHDERLDGERVVPLGRNAVHVARETALSGADGRAFVWLTAVHGLLLEVRFDVAPGFEIDGEIGREEILEALGRAIPSAQAVQRARQAAADVAQTHMALVLDAATPEQERPLWMTYLYARAAHAASALGDRTPAPGEPVASFEEEVRARTVAVHAYRSLRDRDGQPASAYFSDLDRVEAAGFLREYVWHYLRQASWGAEPAGLALDAFDAWRAVHLPHHVPVTHGRLAWRPRS